MKEYKYVRCNNLENYPDWDIVKIIPHKTENEYDMAVIMKEDRPVREVTCLSEATNQELIEELQKRLGSEE